MLSVVGDEPQQLNGENDVVDDVGHVATICRCGSYDTYPNNPRRGVPTHGESDTKHIGSVDGPSSHGMGEPVGGHREPHGLHTSQSPLPEGGSGGD